MISIMVDFSDDVANAKQFFNKLSTSDDQRVTIPFGNQTAEDQIGQIVDKYGITWSIVSNN